MPDSTRVIPNAADAGTADADAHAEGPAKLPVAAVTASGDDGNLPANTVDGNPATRWSAKGDGQWIQWDLGASQTVSQVRIAFYKGDSRVSTFDLEVSDGTTPVRVFTGRRTRGATTQLETFDFPAVTGRYVRYVGHGNSGIGSGWNSLTEAELWGGQEETNHPSSNLVTYPPPPSLTTSSVYRVYAGSPEQEVWTEQFTKNRTIHIANFSAAGETPIRVTVSKPFDSVQISPKSRHLSYTKEGNSIRFTISKPENLILFFKTSGGELDPLYLFANPVEADPPTATTPKVRYFGPGRHEAGDITLQTGETVYIAGGALVVGRIVANNAHSITVRGRGMLQETTGDDFSYSIRMQDCQNVLVDGITVRDVQRGWSSRYDSCDGVIIRDVKVISSGINGDGIDPVGSRNLTIDGCLISAGDDCIAIKSFGPTLSGITVRNTVLDSYPGGGGGDGIKIGTETQCTEMRDILVQNCDVVRCYGTNSVGGHSAFSIVHNGPARIHNVRYEDIRVEGRIEKKDFEIRLLESGTVSDVTLKNISWEVAKPINLIGSGISNVTFDNCTVAGKVLTAASDPPLKIDSGLHGITFTHSPVDHAKSPGQVLDLQRWKLTVPKGDEVTEIFQPALQTFSDNDHFFVDDTGTGVVFKVHHGEGTTDHSKNPRSELREMTADGSTEIAWNGAEGTHALTLTGQVNRLTKVKPQVVIAQVHNGNDDLTTFRLEGTQLYITDKNSNAKLVDANFKLKTRYHIKIQVTGGKTSYWYNDQKIDFSLDNNDTKNFFKAGNYLQSNQKTAPEESRDEYSEVVIYDLKVSR